MKKPRRIPRYTELPRSTAPISRSPLPRGGIRRKGRTPSEYARIYGSRARVRWVKTLGCVAATSFCSGEIDGHHVVTGGANRKADADQIVPICRWHHAMLHNHGTETFSARFALDLPALAAETQRRFLAAHPESKDAA